MPSNKFSTSYGIIVKTQDNRTVVLKRKVPYCVQSYFVHLARKDDQPPDRFAVIRRQFETEWLPTLEPHEQLDYQRFLKNQPYEDMYDFPHGQLPRKRKPVSKLAMFKAAYREFQEESGFHFKFSKKDIERYPMVHMQFVGCDGCTYQQYYFIVDNVVGLKRHSYFSSFHESSAGQNQIQTWKDDRLVYHGQLVPIHLAYEKLLHQQEIKPDLKHLLCLETSKLFESVIHDEDRTLVLSVA